MLSVARPFHWRESKMYWSAPANASISSTSALWNIWKSRADLFFTIDLIDSFDSFSSAMVSMSLGGLCWTGRGSPPWQLRSRPGSSHGLEISVVWRIKWTFLWLFTEKGQHGCFANVPFLRRFPVLLLWCAVQQNNVDEPYAMKRERRCLEYVDFARSTCSK